MICGLMLSLPHYQTGAETSQVETEGFAFDNPKADIYLPCNKYKQVTRRP